MSSASVRAMRRWYPSISMSRTWQTCSSAVSASLGTPSQDAGAQCRYAAGMRA